MATTRTINVKGLEHRERENLIFPALEALQQDEALKIVLEFNPLPLMYMLKAQKELDVSLEKEGPEEWIVNIKRTAPTEDKKERFKELLKELRGGRLSEETKEKAKGLFQAVDAKTLGILEQELIREGVSHDEIRRSLCDIHLEAIRDALVSKKMEVSAPHPIHTFMEEHKIILNSLNELNALLERLRQAEGFKGIGEDLEKLKDISHHLVEAESHHQREEEALFPGLEKHDIVEPASIMKTDHVEFRAKKRDLYRFSYNAEDYEFEDFKQEVLELGQYLVKELESHIFKEDNILYQIALQVLSQEEWEEVKRGCDKIGYCCFTPEDQTKEQETVELDLRPMPPFERHEKIFKTWNSLKPGQALRIINDHDPKPLRYQFEAEEKGKYEWNYEEQGPRDWRVRIQRVL